MPKHIERGNATQSKIRTCVEHVFGHQKGPMDLSIRTIGLERAATKMTLANLTYNMKRLIFHERRCTLGCVRPKSGSIRCSGAIVTISVQNHPQNKPNSPHASVTRNHSPQHHSKQYIDRGVQFLTPTARNASHWACLQNFCQTMRQSILLCDHSREINRHHAPICDHAPTLDDQVADLLRSR